MPQDETPEESLAIAADIIRQAFDVRQAAIYQASPEDPNFHLSASNGDLTAFPEIFASADIARLSEIQIWLPGKRMHVDLHRAGRMNNLAYVASAPLGQTGVWVGLLALGGARAPIERIEVYLDLFATQLTRIIEHHLLVTELKRQISEAWQSLVVSQAVMDNASEGMLALSLGDRDAVDALNAAAAANGGQADINPAQDHGFMYSRAVADPDGHVWEAFWMDPAAVPSD